MGAHRAHQRKYSRKDEVSKQILEAYPGLYCWAGVGAGQQGQGGAGLGSLDLMCTQQLLLNRITGVSETESMHLIFF